MTNAKAQAVLLTVIGLLVTAGLQTGGIITSDGGRHAGFAGEGARYW